MNDRNVYIVGAGISGLVAALELEKAGYYPVILESTDRIGGRIKSEKMDGYTLDRGFQVLLTSYPEARRYLDFDALELKLFKPGAVILKPGDTFSVHDPFRNPLRMIPMAFSKVGTLWDKFKMFQLTKMLKKKTIEQIFSSPQTTTLEYLKDFGFSDRILNNFFIPFYKGVFLETELKTSSRMFEFIFKMFSEGNAALPAKGMEEIPRQLLAQLKFSKIQYNTKVTKIEKNIIQLESGNTLTADDIIIAADAGNLLNEVNNFRYHFVTNIYFTTQQSFMGKAMIGLVPDSHFLINNLVFLTDISKSYSEDGRALLSVSIVKEMESLDNIEKMVALELEALTGISADFFKHLKTIQIPQALPDLTDCKHWIPAQHTKVYDHVFMAGDQLLNGSINAAMTSGRLAAEGVIADIVKEGNIS
ncbi:MAG: NAD(P)/FAD-dependent oxidoreductase [Cyclobacteriaceae bacterium]